MHLEERMNKMIQILTLLLMLAAFLMAGCTTSSTGQLKESVCKDCLEKTPFYRNGEWLS
jgi:hypothetical protein